MDCFVAFAPRNDGWACLHPDLRLLVFCVRLPCAACSRMLCFSSSRWPLVVSRGTAGALPGPLSLRAPAGTDLMVLVDGFVIFRLRHSPKPTLHVRGAFPRTLSSRPLHPTAYAVPSASV